MKRLTKIFLFALLALLLVLAGLVIYVRVQYPSERLRQIVIATLAEKFHFDAQIESLSFHLFSGFTLKQLTLSALAPNRSETPLEFKTALSIDEITLAYRWRSLFSGRLDIDALTLTRPSVSYWQAADSSTNLEALFAALQDTSANPRDTSATSLPLTLNLNTIQLDEMRIKLAVATQTDTQRLALGPFALTIEELNIARDVAYRARFKLDAKAAPLVYSLCMHDSARNVEYRSHLNADLKGNVALDALAPHGEQLVMRGEIAFMQNALRYGGTPPALLPELALQAEAQYSFPSSQLNIPSFALHLNKQEILNARYAQRTQGSTTLFDLHVERGQLDLAQISQLAHALGYTLDPSLTQLSATGTLDFSNSELHQTPAGLHYQLNLRGENVGYHDRARGLQLDSVNTRLAWRSDKGDGSSTFESEFSFRTFDFLLDTTRLHTGPGQAHASGTLTEKFSLAQLQWELDWRNLARASVRSNGRFERDEADRMRLNLNLSAHDFDLAPFTADTLQGKVSGEIKVAGTEWEQLEVASTIHHGELFYLLEEDRLRFPPVDWTLNARLKLAPDFSDWQFTLGTLRGEPATANFTARYQSEPGMFQFDLNNATLKLDYVLGILPQSFFEGLNPKLAGASTANGWMNFDFSSLGKLEYTGKFLVNSERAMFTDDSLGIYADWLELQSTWDLATQKTTGAFTLNLRATRMPDYVALPLPLTIANGKIEIDEETFVIKEGSFNAAGWQLSGDYRVAGSFLREGLQVQTTISAAMNAPAPVTVDRGLALQGKLAGRMVLEQYFPDDKNAAQPSHISVALHTEKFNVSMDTSFALENMNADLSFAQDFDFLTLALSSPQVTATPQARNANEALLLYDVLGRRAVVSNSQVRVEKLRLREYEFSDVVADLNLGQGRFDIPQLRMNFLGGNVRGNMLVGYGNGNLEEVTYSTALQISSIDVSRLRGIAGQVEKGAQLSADFYINGKGAAPQQLNETLNNLIGKLNITKIEKKTATNLLAALDPNGTDAGIQRMRLLLKTGWNVKYMTFEIKNGFVYASLAPVKTKPWAALFNLPTTLDFARLPVRYFVEE